MKRRDLLGAGVAMAAAAALRAASAATVAINAPRAISRVGFGCRSIQPFRSRQVPANDGRNGARSAIPSAKAEWPRRVKKGNSN
jgi:hypothetical protein